MSSFSRSVIPYYPILSKKLGSVTSAILFRQLEYWFEKMDYKPFYKFLNPCEHNSYKIGESWTEELGMSEIEFRTAFSKIGVIYKSKKEFDSTADKFQGKYYCSYIDRLERKTYYLRNHNLVIELDKELNNYVSPRNEETQFLEMRKPNFYKLGNPISRNEETQFPITVEYTVEYQNNKTNNISTEKSVDRKSELFEIWWNKYSVKDRGSKSVAKKLFSKLTYDEIEIVNNHTDYYIEHTEKKYRKNGDRYLRERLFECEIPNQSSSEVNYPADRKEYEELLANKEFLTNKQLEKLKKYEEIFK